MYTEPRTAFDLAELPERLDSLLFLAGGSAGVPGDRTELTREPVDLVTEYGWPASAAHDRKESNRRLLELNRAIAAGEVEYRPFD